MSFCIFVSYIRLKIGIIAIGQYSVAMLGCLTLGKGVIFECFMCVGILSLFVQILKAWDISIPIEQYISLDRVFLPSGGDSGSAALSSVLTSHPDVMIFVWVFSLCMYFPVCCAARWDGVAQLNIYSFQLRAMLGTMHICATLVQQARTYHTSSTPGKTKCPVSMGPAPLDYVTPRRICNRL